MSSDPVCDACAGTGQPVSGKPCICGGSGYSHDEKAGLRRRLHETELQLGIAKKHLLGLMCDCGKGVEVPPEGHAADCNGVHWADLTKE